MTQLRSLLGGDGRAMLVLGAVLAAAGVVLVIVGSELVATIGSGLVGMAVVFLLAAVFLAVGRSEDRDRAGGTA